jgi:hypothetical protein
MVADLLLHILAGLWAGIEFLALAVGFTVLTLTIAVIIIVWMQMRERSKRW